MDGQQIRRSQFITTYGPGAIIEGPEGPRVVPTLERSGIFTGPVRPDQYEITDSRLSRHLLGNARIVALPSNAELGREELTPVYHTDPFPKWSLCVEHGILYRKRRNDNVTCPRCPLEGSSPAAWRKAGREKIRFIQVCPHGHMEDVHWSEVVAQLGKACNNCNPDYYRWQGSGASLRSISIICPVCGGVANLGQAYGRPWRCNGVFAEEAGPAMGCTATASIVQRGAANVFVPEILSALTIPQAALSIHRLLGQRVLVSVFTVMPPTGLVDVQQTLDRLVAAGQLSQSTRDTIVSHGEQEVMRAISEVMQAGNPQTEAEMRLAEFRSLRDASAHGYPRAVATSTPDFEVVRADVRTFPAPNGGRIRVTPISRLRVVMVQTGYHRLDGGAVDRVANIDNERWYPGVQLFGEGIFVDLVDDAGAGRELVPQGREAMAWSLAYQAAAAGSPGWEWLAGEPTHAHPMFVWWHTLSHRLIAALALSCGYSAAAIRERVYMELDGQGHAHGGVLMYTVQPGGDGTLGGLVSLVGRFDEILNRAFHDLDACSNDPLCSDEAFQPGRVNGPACFACLFQSETSCEHRNMSLDRNLLLRNMP